MALINFNFSQVYEDSYGWYFEVGQGITVARGDTLNFIFGGASPSGYRTTPTISGFTSALTASTTNLTFPNVGSTGSKVISLSAPLQTYTLTLTAPSYPARSIIITVVSNEDTVPNYFSVPNVTNAMRSQYIESNTITVLGINVAVNATITGGTSSVQKNNSGSWLTSVSVVKGDTLKFRTFSSSVYGGTVNTNIAVGGRSTPWAVTVGGDPGEGEIINFPITSGTIKLTDVINFFGGTSSLAVPLRNLRAYLRGGQYVPDITKNKLIPISGTLSLRQFLGSGTALFFTQLGRNQDASRNNISSPGTLSLYWSFIDGLGGGTGRPVDPSVGFGNIRNAVDYRWTVVEDPADVNTNTFTGITINPYAGTAAQIGNWQANNGGLQVRITAPQAVERIYSGTITVFVRSQYDNSKVISTSFKYLFYFYGV